MSRHLALQKSQIVCKSGVHAFTHFDVSCRVESVHLHSMASLGSTHSNLTSAPSMLIRSAGVNIIHALDVPGTPDLSWDGFDASCVQRAIFQPSINAQLVSSGWKLITQTFISVVPLRTSFDPNTKSYDITFWWTRISCNNLISGSPPSVHPAEPAL